MIPLIIGVVVVSRAWSSAHRKVEAAESPQEIARTQTEKEAGAAEDETEHEAEAGEHSCEP